MLITIGTLSRNVFHALLTPQRSIWTGFWMLLLQSIAGILMLTIWLSEDVERRAASTMGTTLTYQVHLGSEMVC
jgi:hypothetical protein